METARAMKPIARMAQGKPREAVRRLKVIM